MTGSPGGASGPDPAERAAPEIRARYRIERPGFVLDADLVLPGRGVTAIFGPSGSGKTTLLRAIAGLDPVPGGHLSVHGQAWQDESTGVNLPPEDRGAACVFQDALLFPHLSVRDNLHYGRRRRPGASDQEIARTVERLGLGSLLGRMPAGLSGGERQRVALARALLASPRLLLLDEPLASLDAALKDEILPHLERLHGELRIPVLYVTHAPDEVARLADHLVLLSDGQVTASGPMADVLARIDLPDSFGADAGVVIDGQVAGYDREYGLLHVVSAAGGFRVPRRSSEPTGTRLRLRIRSRDVSLALERPRDTSILNVLQATVSALEDAGTAPQLRVRLQVGDTTLVALITRLSRDRLQLAPGRTVWAQVKAVAVVK